MITTGQVCYNCDYAATNDDCQAFAHQEICRYGDVNFILFIFLLYFNFNEPLNLFCLYNHDNKNKT